jgi:alkylation response protein AidB-like acyl-CoA dehydrogenase
MTAHGDRADAVVREARRIADEILFPRALPTDAAGLVPKANLDVLADAGLYGLAGPEEAGGSGVDLPTACRVFETLAGGCLTTAFVWAQHHGAVAALSADDAPATLRAEWLVPLCRGERRAGVSFAGLLPRAAVLAREVDGGWILDGTAPWVSGWGRVDVIHASARTDADAADGGTIVRALIDAEAGARLTVEPLRLVAVDASGTVTVRFDGYFVPFERVTGMQAYEEWAARDASFLRMNGSFALGVAGRSLRLLGPSALDDELVSVRDGLDEAAPDVMPAARARASEFALRATTTLVVSEGARAVVVDHHAQRLAREALFLLVFGSRAPIRTALIERLARGTGRDEMPMGHNGRGRRR